MLNEKRDEFSGWAGRLEEPGALAGQGLKDKEGSWDKLHARLGNPPRRKALAWYWIAAACLLLALIPAVLLFKGAHTGKDGLTQAAGSSHLNLLPGANTPAPKMQPDQALTSTAARQQPDPTAAVAAMKVQTGPTGTSIANAGSSAPASHPVVTPGVQHDGLMHPFGQHDIARAGFTTHALRDGTDRDFRPGTHTHQARRQSGTLVARVTGIPADVRDSTVNETALSVAAPTTPTLAANLPSPAPAKKILRVISINEIPGPEELGPSLAGRQWHPPAFRIGLLHAGAFRPAIASQQPSKHVFIIKLSSQNP